MMRTLRKNSQNNNRIDVLNHSIWRIVVNVGGPLLIVYIISVFLTTYTNDVYSQYIGKTVFLISGVISSVVTLFSNVTSSINSSTWIRNATVYSVDTDQQKINRTTLNSIYTIVIVAMFCMVFMFLGKDFLFQLLCVPEEIEWEAGMYYNVQASLILLTGISGVLDTIIIATSKGIVLFAVILFSSSSAAISAFIFVSVFKLGLWGWLLGTIPITLIYILIQIHFLRKNGILVNIKRAHFLPEWKNIRANIKYGCILFIQMVFCVAGEMLISMQSNRYLDMDAIATISVSLPLTSVFSLFSTLCSIFVPLNYGAGKTERLKKFIYGLIAFGTIYSVGCALFYIFAGEWYFETLFDDPNMIMLGKEYWFWYGLSMIPLCMIYIVRFFFDYVGKANISILSGIGEFVGRLVCAFALIPYMGNVGRFCAPLIGWGLGSSLLVIMFIKHHNEIFHKCDENRFDSGN